jgi:hypothetical protein
MRKVLRRTPRPYEERADIRTCLQREQKCEDTSLSWRAMLCYALCYAMLRYATLCDAMLCYATLSYAMLCYAMRCDAMRCDAMLCYGRALARVAARE